MINESTKAGMSARAVGGVRGRIHGWAKTLHGAIDSLEQKVGSGTQAGKSAQSAYAGQARQYGDTLRGRISARPLQSAGIALATGIVAHKLFGSRSTPTVRVVEVPVPTYSHWDASQPQRRARSWMHATRAEMRAAADQGRASLNAASSSLTRTVIPLSLQMRLATQRLLDKSHEYGSIARVRVQEHPLMGVGVMLGVGALVATSVLQGRRMTTSDTPYVTADNERSGTSWQREQRDSMDMQTRATELISSRPVTSAVVVLGLGALVGAMLKR